MLIVMSARYYDPATGRFISQDTYTGTPYAPWTQHLYSYCGNNPVNMVDPTGHMPIKPMAVCDGGTTRVVPEPSGSDENVSWWNKTVDWIGNAASDAWNWIENAAIDVGDFFKSTFGWEYINETDYVKVYPNPLSWSPIKYEMSETRSTVIESGGNGYKPILFYLDKVNGSFFESSVGMKVSKGDENSPYKYDIDYRIGVDDIGFSFGNDKHRFRLSVSLKEVGRIRIGTSNAIPAGNYTSAVLNQDIVIDPLIILLAFATAGAGSSVPVPAY